MSHNVPCVCAFSVSHLTQQYVVETGKWFLVGRIHSAMAVHTLPLIPFEAYCLSSSLERGRILIFAYIFLFVVQFDGDIILSIEWPSKQRSTIKVATHINAVCVFGIADTW